MNQAIGLETRNLCVRYGPREAPHAIRDLSLQFAANQTTILLGPSGAGKSTLLRCLNGLVTPTEGSVHTADFGPLADPRALRRHRLRTGMIFQLHNLIGRATTLANVLQGRLGRHSVWRSLWPLPKEDLRIAWHALERVGLADKALKRTDRLSGGERQRVGIARALAQEATILLADEPVASLDLRTSHEILQLLFEICQNDGLTAIISLHQVDLARRFGDHAVGLSEGRLVFEGSLKALSPEDVARIYEPQWEQGKEGARISLHGRTMKE